MDLTTDTRSGSDQQPLPGALADEPPARVIELPRLSSIARNGIPHLVEATAIPLVLFYTSLELFGRWPALCSALAWSLGALAVRVLRRRRLPGILILAALALSIRTAIALVSGSVFVYFVQPVAGSVAMGLAFLVTLPLGGALIAKFTADFYPLPTSVTERPAVRRLFRQLSVLWAVVNLGTATLTFWLLVTQSLAAFVLMKTLAAMALNAAGVALTIRSSLRVAHREGFRVQRQGPLVPVPAL